MDYQSQPASSQMRWKWIAVGVIALIVVAVVIWYFAGSNGKVLGTSTTSTYQAVFLTNGQVYFGKLSDKGGNWIDLTSIYYLQVTQNLQDAASSDQAKNATPATGAGTNNQSNIQLVKLGSELHGPTDSMHIERDKVLFWEDMKSDSKVMQAIQSYQSK